MADEAKVPIPPGVHPLFLTMSTQEKFACVEMKDCTSEKPYVYVTKKVFLDDIQFRGAISDFHPVKKQIEKYPDSEEEGLAIVWDENEDYGQNFYICLTVKAKDAVVEKYAALAEAPPTRPPAPPPRAPAATPSATRSSRRSSARWRRSSRRRWASSTPRARARRPRAATNKNRDH